MRQVLSRARALLGRPAVLATVLLLGGGGAALVLLPLFGVPGFELGLALAIAVGLLGGGTGIAAAAQERRILTGALPRPAGVEASALPGTAVGRALGASAVLNLGVLVPPFVCALLFARLRTACDPFELAGFYPLLTVPSALLASAAGVFLGFATARPGARPACTRCSSSRRWGSRCGPSSSAPRCSPSTSSWATCPARCTTRPSR